MTANQMATYDLEDNECWVVALLYDGEVLGGYGRPYRLRHEAYRRAKELRERFPRHEVRVFHGALVWTDETETENEAA